MLYLKKEIRKLSKCSGFVNRQNMGRKYSINITDTSFKNVAKFKYWVTTQSILGNNTIKSQLPARRNKELTKSRNACYHLVQNI